MYPEDEFLALSGIQHFAFCRRQWALIHIDQEWSENLLTAQGDLMHERAHNEALRERRGSVLTVRGLTVRSPELGIWGKCDVVEFHQSDDGFPLAGEEGLWHVVPVEYKHGRSKPGNEDRLQLCAQAMCLESMFACELEEGFLYYGATRSRELVALTDELREQVKGCVAEMHALYARHHVPRVKRSGSCRACSLVEICLPKAIDRPVARYMSSMLGGGDETEIQLPSGGETGCRSRSGKGV